MFLTHWLQQIASQISAVCGNRAHRSDHRRQHGRRRRLHSGISSAFGRQAAERLESRTLLSVQAVMVEDSIPGDGINIKNHGSNPAVLSNIAGTLYFRADDGINGLELWRINNTTGLVEMVEDSLPGGGISPGSGSSNPRYLTKVNGTLYFTANDGINGEELWRINDTTGLAEMVEDHVPGGGIIPGANADWEHRLSYLTNVDGTLYFRANDGTNGEELWRINSTTGLAEMVEDGVPGGGISPVYSSSNPGQLTKVGGTVYFSAIDGPNGYKLWQINSTTGLAEVVEDSVPDGGIDPGIGHSSPRWLTNVNGTLYFQAYDSTNGYELWRINSTTGLAEMVEDSVPDGGINPGSWGSDPNNLTNVNGILYFNAYDDTNGRELWRINNSTGLVEMVEDSVPDGGINPGSWDSDPNNLTNVNGILYFLANNDTNGRELWRINSTTGLAEVVEDSIAGGGIRPDSGYSSPRYLTNVNGTLYFTADDGTNGRELWRINTTTGLAEMVEDSLPGGGIRPGSGNSYLAHLTNVDGTLYFIANDGTNGRELWRINTTTGLAEMVEDSLPGGGIRPGGFSSYAAFLTNVNGTLYFRANDAVNGDELWRINNTTGLAEMVEDSVPGKGIHAVGYGSYPTQLTNVNGTLYFFANDGANGSPFWWINASTGLAENAEDYLPGDGSIPGIRMYGLNHLTNVNGTLYFTANDSSNGEELWRINSTTGMAEMIEDGVPGGGIGLGSFSSAPYNLTNVNGILYFNANDGTYGAELWRINNITGLAEMVEDSVPGGGIFSIGRPFNLVNGSYFTNVNGTLYFRAYDYNTGLELWRINNTTGLAEVVEDNIAGGGIRPGSGHSSPRYLTNVNGTLYFNANDGTNGYELWRINNTTGLAEMVEDSVPGGGSNPLSGSSSPRFLTNVNGTLYFRANDGTNGQELWRINSTTGLAEMIEDGVPGGGISARSSSSSPYELTNVNGTLYFRAGEATNGWELWRVGSSGLAEVVEDSVPGGGIRPGGFGSYPAALTNVNGTLYFRAFDGTNGAELWRINNTTGLAEMVEDGVPGGGINSGDSHSYPLSLTNVNGTLYFTADDGPNGRELWRINNTTGLAEMIEDSLPGGGIMPGSGSLDPRYLTYVNGTVYFTADDGTNGRELWKIVDESPVNAAPTAVTLQNVTASLAENTTLTTARKVADIAVTDDGLGTNTLSLTGADAASFEILGNALYLKAGVTLDYETQTSFSVTVQVDDTTVGSTPDAETSYTLSVTDVFEPPAVSILAVSDGQEGLSNGRFRVSQSAASATNTVVSYAVAGTATGVAGGVNDYAPLSRTVTIPAGQLFADITVTVANDGLIEATDTVIVTLGSITSGSPGITLSPNAASRTATVNILDNDVATVSIAPLTQGAEASTPVNGTFRVTQTGISTSPTVVHYVISGASTATPGADVGTLSGTVTIPAGQTFADIPVPVFNDAIVEATETLVVTLSSLGAGTDPEITFNSLPARLTATLNITDDDIATVSIMKINDGAESSTPTHGLFRVTQTALSSTDTVVSYAVTGTATRGATADYTMPTGSITIPAGQLSADLVVTVRNDALVEANETVIVTLSGFGPHDPQITLNPNTASRTATVSITDDDIPPVISVAALNDGQEGLSNGRFRVSQSAASATNTVVSYAVAGTATGVAGGVNDYAPLSRTVTIPAGQLFADITVTVANDGLIEATDTVIVTLGSITSGSPGITLSPNAASRTATVNILDNDVATVSIAPLTQGAEASTPVNGTFRVTQTGISTSPTVVHYVISGASTATPGVDVGTLSGTVTIPAGQTSADILVPVVNDAIVEATETLIVTLSSLGAGTDPEITFNSLPARLTATLNITDDDTATVSITKINDGAESSTPTHGLFRVTQTALSSTDTVVSYAVTGTATRGATADYTMPTGSITIPAGQLSADLVVTVRNDALVEANETVIVTLSGFGPHDPQITLDATMANRTATATITDDDAATVSIVKVADGAEAATPTNGLFRIMLSQPSATNTVVTYVLSGSATPGAGGDYTMSTGSATILAGQLFVNLPVQVVNNAVAEATETVIVTLTGITASGPRITLDPLAANRQATVNITDDDAPSPAPLTAPSLTSLDSAFASEGGTWLSV